MMTEGVSLETGEILANLQKQGTVGDLIDKLNIEVTMGASSSANSLQNQCDRPSGPSAVLFSCERNIKVVTSSITGSLVP